MSRLFSLFALSFLVHNGHCAVQVNDLRFQLGNFVKHTCTQDSCEGVSNVHVSYYGKSRSVSFALKVTWDAGQADPQYCHCRLRANMHGFDDPFSDDFDPESLTDGRSTSGGAVVDSKLEPWGTDWYVCWDQNSDRGVTGTQTLEVRGPSDAPFVNLPDGYYHFSAACRDNGDVSTRDLFFKIDNVPPETTITPYVARTKSSIPGITGELPSYDPSAMDHRVRYLKKGSGDPTNSVAPGHFDFRLSVVDYHGSANVDVSPYDPYRSGPIQSRNKHPRMSNGETFYPELDKIIYYCKLFDADGTVVEEADCNVFGKRYGSDQKNYGHYYFSEFGTTGFQGAGTGNRFITTTNLGPGAYVLTVAATDLAGNEELPTMYPFYVAPHKAGGPDAGCSFGYKVSSDNMDAAYTTTDYELTTESAVQLRGLLDGMHTLKVFAKDNFTLETPEAQRRSFSWTVDRTGPDATLTESWSMRNTVRDDSYVANSGSASLTSALFEWGFGNTSTLAVPIFSRYSMDGETFTMDGFATSAASSSAGFSSLSMPPFSHRFPRGTFPPGPHRFEVVGVDYVGNGGRAAVDAFTVEELDTVLGCDRCALCDWSPEQGCHSCQEMSRAYVSDSITFDIRAMSDGSPIRFKYDYAFSENRSAADFRRGEHIPEFTVRNIGEGKYYVQARGRTLSGTRDATPACVLVSTDSTKPVTTINSELRRINNMERMPSRILGTVMDLNWRYDGLTWKVLQEGNPTPIAGPATSARNTSSSAARMLVAESTTNANTAVWELDISDLISNRTLREGHYTLVIHATDKAGLKGSEVEYDWLIDLGPPETHILNGPNTATGSRQVKLTLACEESGAMSYCSYKYRMSPREEYQESSCRLDRFCRIEMQAGVGINTLEVRAVDLAGNEDQTSQYYTWVTYDPETYGAYQRLTNFTSPFGNSPIEFNVTQWEPVGRPPRDVLPTPPPRGPEPTRPEPEPTATPTPAPEPPTAHPTPYPFPIGG